MRTEPVESQTVSRLHQVFTRFGDFNEMCAAHSGMYGLHFTKCVHGQLQFREGGAVVVPSVVRNN
jgi:hypothetical protein